MASSSSSFSSSLETSSTSSAPATTSSNARDRDPAGGAPPNPTSSLPFSFLVTFIAIFLFFLGCGLGSRRVSRGLRRNLGLRVAGGPVGGAGAGRPRGARVRPVLWDVCPCAQEKTEGDSWVYITPLAATFVRPAPPPDQSPPLPPPSAPVAPSMVGWATGGIAFLPTRGAMRAFTRLPVPVPAPPSQPSPSPRATIAPVPGASAPATASARGAMGPELRWRGHRLPDWLARPLLPHPDSPPASVRDARTSLQASPAEPTEERAGGAAVAASAAGKDDAGSAEGLADGEKHPETVEVVVLLEMPSPDRARAWARAGRGWEKAVEARPEGRRDSAGSESLASGKARAADGVEVCGEDSEGIQGDYVVGSARLRWDEGKRDGVSVS